MSRLRDNPKAPGRGHAGDVLPIGDALATAVAWICYERLRVVTYGLRENFEAQLAPRVQPHPGEPVFLCRGSEVCSLSYIRLRYYLPDSLSLWSLLR